MDRREFLKIAAAVPAAAALPGLAEARPALSLASIKVALQGIRQGADSDWYAIVHPQQERDLRDLAARERWSGAYRDWRKDGKPLLTYQQILDKYRPFHEWEVGPMDSIGRYEGFRFIQSEAIPCARP
jgi:ABC-type amino acid transport substrate-binding protein